MSYFWTHLLDTSDFPARWRCGSWDPALGWLHILSDLGIWAAYLAIPLALLWFARRRRDVPFRHLFRLFAAFIVLCGTTHLIDAAVFWWPAYRLAGLVKLATAVVSWATFVALLPVIPKAFAMRYPEELEREAAERRRAEEAARAVIDAAADAIVTADRGGRIVGWNPAAERLFGHPAADALGRGVALIIPDRFRAAHAAGLAGYAPGRPSAVLGRVVPVVGLRRDGSEFPAELTVTAWAAGGEPFFTSIVRDVTERRAAADAVARSERHYRAVFDHAHDPILVLDPGDERVLDANPAACRAYGVAREELVGRSLAARSADPAGGRRHVAAATDGRPSHAFETVQFRADGSRLELEVRATAVEFDGRPAVLSVNRDVTERNRAEAARREREAATRARAAVAAAVAGGGDKGAVLDACCRAVVGELGAAFARAWVLPAGGSVLELRASAGRHTHTDGGHARVPVGRLKIGRIAADGRPHVTDDVPNDPLIGDPGWARREGLAAFAGYPLVADGRVVGVLAAFFPAPVGGPARDALAAAAGLVAQFIDRRRAEDGMRLRDRAIGAFVQGVTIADAARPELPLVYVNPGFERMTGYAAAEALGRSCRFLQGPGTDPRAAADMRAALREGRACLVEVLNYRKDGTPFWNAVSVAPVRDDGGALTHFVGVQTDVTPFKDLEGRLLQAQKMDAVGQLAGGVAHDFNNLLTVINGYADLALEGLPPGDPGAALMGEVIASGRRAADLTRQLLAFSRKQVLQPRRVGLNELVAGVQKMLARVLGEDVALATALRPAAGAVVVDPGQLEQVLVNLAVNARDAMPTGGRLTIETGAAELDAAYADGRPDVRPGRYALLAVTDTGTGMTDAVKARLFEPFFTTKGVGQGTGLGLATVFGIVKQSGGHVAVYSEVGRGTTFKVYLPAADGAGPAAAAAPPPPPGGREAVLLVEDEGKVRALAGAALRRAGYAVVEAGDAAAAEEAAAGRAVDLLVTDVVMPGDSGRVLAGRLTAARPGLRVLYMSGYTDDAVVRHGLLHAEVAFLQKPFAVADLLRKVRAVLDAPAPGLSGRPPDRGPG